MFCSVPNPLLITASPSQTENHAMHFYITCSAVFVPRNPTFLRVTQLPVGMKHMRESSINQVAHFRLLSYRRGIDHRTLDESGM